MGAYASKGVANTALGISIGSGVLALLQNGGLSNFLGGGNQLATLQAENAMLKAENYSDKVGKEVYEQTRAENAAQKAELMGYIKPLAEEAANNRVNIASLQEQLKCCCEKQELREQILIGKINEVGLATNGRFASLEQTISSLSGQVNSFGALTKTIIPLSSVCPEPMRAQNAWVAPTSTTTPSA